MSVCIQEDVIGLDVSVHVSQLVYRVDGQDHLHDVELGHVLRETVLKLGQQGQQVTPAVVVHHQVQVGLVLEKGD